MTAIIIWVATAFASVAIIGIGVALLKRAIEEIRKRLSARN